MFVAYTVKSNQKIETPHGVINSFVKKNEQNIDKKTVDSFGEEWSKFNDFSNAEIEQVGDDYFDILPSSLYDNEETLVLDVGCGTGRWAKYLANKVKTVECIDPSDAVITARHLLRAQDNVRISKASVNNIPFPDESFDLVFSLGVLHHIPDTEDGIRKCVAKVKKGGYFLVYLYYSLDNRGVVFKTMFWLVNLLRLVVSNMPQGLKSAMCDILAFLVYVPMVLLAKIAKLILPSSQLYKNIPLSYYEDKSLRIIRNDSLDRFGTPLEKRFSKMKIQNMLKNAGLNNIIFSESEPYWHVIAQKA